MARQTIVSTQQAERITDRALRHIRPIFGKCYGYPEITADEIARTHKVRSRISHAQLDWFIRTAVDAPWAAAPIEAQLVEADPNISGELYDRAEALYDHFRTAAPRRVGVAKISKVLHLKRPGLFPILDSKVRWVRSRWRRRSSWALSASRGDAMAEESTLGSTVNKCAV